MLNQGAEVDHRWQPAYFTYAGYLLNKERNFVVKVVVHLLCVCTRVLAYVFIKSNLHILLSNATTLTATVCTFNFIRLSFGHGYELVFL